MNMRPPPLHHLSDKVIRVQRIDGVRKSLRSVVILALCWGITFVVTKDWGWASAITAAVFAVELIINVVVLPPLYAKFWRYEISDHEVYLQRGFFTIVRHVIPLVRVQNVNTTQGPIGRWYGVSALTISTAGGDVVIPVLEDEVAENLRIRLSERARAAGGGINAG